MATNSQLKEEPYIDVPELCAILQCLGYNLRSLEAGEYSNVSSGGANKMVVISCQSSGLHAVLQSNVTRCSCCVLDHSKGGVWSVCGMSGGKQYKEERDFSAVLPAEFRAHLCGVLKVIVRNVRAEIQKADHQIEVQETMKYLPKWLETNHTPEKICNLDVKEEEPSVNALFYSSLETILNKNKTQPITSPVSLPTAADHNTSKEFGPNDSVNKCFRQGTYSVSTPRKDACASPFIGHSPRSCSVTSPRQMLQPNNNMLMLEKLENAEKMLEQLRRSMYDMKIQMCSVSYTAENENKLSSLPNIYRMKSGDMKKFPSSPNLIGPGVPSMGGFPTPHYRMPGYYPHPPGVPNAVPIIVPTTGAISKKRETPSAKRTIEKNRSTQFNRVACKIKKVVTKSNVKNDAEVTTTTQGLITPTSTIKRMSSTSSNASSGKRFSHIKSSIPKFTPKKE